MNLLADESVDQPIVQRLRQEGHGVVYVAELSPGITDEEVLRPENRQKAIFGDGGQRFRRACLPPAPRAWRSGSRPSVGRPGSS